MKKGVTSFMVILIVLAGSANFSFAQKLISEKLNGFPYLPGLDSAGFFRNPTLSPDGEGENGLYTQELIKAIRIPGLTIEEVFKQVRRNVLELSNGEQIPWETMSLTGDFYFYPISEK